MKTIIVGPPFVSKSTLVHYLRDNSPSLDIKELDELLIESNRGVWPTDEIFRNHVLLPQVIEKTLTQDIIFFTSYISPEDIIKARQNGFKLIQLYLPVNELKKRNINNDLAREAEMNKNLIYQNEIWELGLIDARIHAGLTTKDLAKQIENLIK